MRLASSLLRSAGLGPAAQELAAATRTCALQIELHDQNYLSFCREDCAKSEHRAGPDWHTMFTLDGFPLRANLDLVVDMNLACRIRA